jgi:hypothetical protein
MAMEGNWAATKLAAVLDLDAGRTRSSFLFLEMEEGIGDDGFE